MKFYLKFKSFHSRKCIWNCRLLKLRPSGHSLNVLIQARLANVPLYWQHWVWAQPMRDDVPHWLSPYPEWSLHCTDPNGHGMNMTLWHGSEWHHDDVIKWKPFPRYWPFVRGIHRSPVNSHHRDQWRGALMFSWICAWTNGWVNNRDAGDLRRHHAHCDVTVTIHWSTLQKAKSELWWFLCSQPKRIIEQTAKLPVIWNAMTFI